MTGALKLAGYCEGERQAGGGGASVPPAIEETIFAATPASKADSVSFLHRKRTDIISLNKYSWPAWAGGPTYYIAQVGRMSNGDVPAGPRALAKTANHGLSIRDQGHRCFGLRKGAPENDRS